MKIQKTYKNHKPTIFLVGTPIGNLQDFSYRAIDTLKAVDEIYCEDTRTSNILLKHYDIKKPLISLHKFNEASRTEGIISSMNQNRQVAIISDAGVPVICDPGAKVVSKLIASEEFPNFNITAVNAGPAYIHALILSGSENISNNFLGFWEQKAQAQEEVIANFQTNQTYVFYESVHRINQTLNFIAQRIDGDSNLLIGREITKLNEEFVWLKASEIDEYLATNQLIEKGEFVVVLTIASNQQKNLLSEEEQIAKINEYKNNGLNTKSAIIKVAQDFGLNKNKLYELFHKK